MPFIAFLCLIIFVCLLIGDDCFNVFGVALSICFACGLVIVAFNWIKSEIIKRRTNKRLEEMEKEWFDRITNNTEFDKNTQENKSHTEASKPSNEQI